MSNSQNSEQLRTKLEAAERALVDCRNYHELYRNDAEARLAQCERERNAARTQLETCQVDLEIERSKCADWRRAGENHMNRNLELRAQLDAAVEMLAASERERDEARAQAARRREALELISNNGKSCAMVLLSIPSAEEYGRWAQAEIARAALAETPAASLEAIRAPLEAKIYAMREALQFVIDCGSDDVDWSGASTKESALAVCRKALDASPAECEARLNAVRAEAVEKYKIEQRGLEDGTSHHPDHCPVSGLPFFMTIASQYDDSRMVATYGGPFDSYTIPVWSKKDDNFTRERYDHDAGGWVDGCETIGLVLRDESDLLEREEKIRAEAGRERELAAWSEALAIATQKTVALNETPGSQMAAAGAGLVTCAIGKRRDEIAKEGE